MSTQTRRTFWGRLPGSQQVQSGWKAFVNFLENTKVLNRSLLWYISGWRLALVALVLAVIFPQEYDDSYIVIAISIGIYILMSLGLNIVVGYAGLLDLGYVAFFAIGAYTYAALSSGFISDANHNAISIPTYSFWLLIPLGAILAGVAGVLLGAPTLRLRGDYLAIVTLGFGEMIHVFFLNIPFFFGTNGLQPNPAPAVGGIDFGSYTDHTAFYYLVLFFVVLAALLVSVLRNSSLGRAWIAIREDETAASAAGVNLVRTKLLAFGMGAFIGGIGGVLYAATSSSIDPDQFVFGFSIIILVMIVLGGIGSIPGVIIGAILLQYFNLQILGSLNGIVHNSSLVANVGAPFHFLVSHDFNQDKFLLFGLILLVMVLLRPQGLIPDVRRRRELKEASSVEAASAVGALAIEEAGDVLAGVGTGDTTEYVGPGSDAQGREE